MCITLHFSGLNPNVQLVDAVMPAENLSVPSDSVTHSGTAKDIQCCTNKDGVDQCNNVWCIGCDGSGSNSQPSLIQGMLPHVWLLGGIKLCCHGVIILCMRIACFVIFCLCPL